MVKLAWLWYTWAMRGMEERGKMKEMKEGDERVRARKKERKQRKEERKKESGRRGENTQKNQKEEREDREDGTGRRGDESASEAKSGKVEKQRREEGQKTGRGFQSVDDFIFRQTLYKHIIIPVNQPSVRGTFDRHNRQTDRHTNPETERKAACKLATHPFRQSGSQGEGHKRTNSQPVSHPATSQPAIQSDR